MRTTLSNGLKVVLTEDHNAPVVALNVWVRTGSADELPGEFGMAHVFEHMLFKGTERRAVGEIASSVEAAGGNINAFTSFDMTVYHITMASRDAALGVDVLADAVQFSTFDPEELAKEMEVVVEEINRGEDSPGRVLSQALFDLAFEEHPYRRPVIGTEESVRSFSRQQMLDFHKRWYVANNITFVAVGDFDAQEMLAQVERVFATSQPNSALAHPRAAEPTQTNTRAILVRRPFNQTLFGLVYPITGFSDPDTAYLDLLSMVLGAGESSRLYRGVKDRLELVHTVSASAYTPRDAGLFFIDAALEAENIEPAIAAIQAEVERLAAYGPLQTELERARVNLLSQSIHEKETMQGQARKLGYYETLGGGIEQEAEYLAQIRAASVDDLKRVAREYLKPERATLGVMLPEKERPELTSEAMLEALAGASGERTTAQAEELRDGILRYTLPNGLRVIVKPNPAVELVSMRLSFLGGLLAEDEDTQGINSMLAEMLERGTEQRSAAQFAAAVEDIAGGVGGFSGRNSFGLVGGFLSDSLDTGLELFADALLHPAFDEGELEKLRRDTLAALDRREDQLAQKAFELFATELYPGHPYRFTTIGSRESVSSLTTNDLRAFYEKYAVPTNGVLAVVGNVDPERFIEALGAQLADWEASEKVELPPRQMPAAPDAPREASIQKGKNQVHIIVGFPGLSVSDPDLAALDVLTQVLAGQGGRLFLELRDKRSLAYSVSAFSIEGLDPGSFGLYIASAPDKLEEAEQGLRDELAKVLDNTITEDELERARNYLIGSHDVSLQRFSTQASLLSLDELYGLTATHHLDYGKRVSAVTLADVERVAHRVIQLDRPLVVIVK